MRGAFIFHAIATPSTRRVTTFPYAVQIAINIALAAWGYTEMAKSKTK